MKIQVSMKSKVFRNPLQLIRGFKNFGGDSVDYLKITKDSLKIANLRPNVRVAFQPQMQMSPVINNVKVAFFNKREGRVL